MVAEKEREVMVDLNWNSLLEKEQKLTLILDGDNVYGYLRKAKLDPGSFKDHVDQRLKNLGIKPSDKQLLTETSNLQLQKWFTTPTFTTPD